MTPHAADRAPWEVGHAQPVLLRLLQEGRLTGPLLDVGCGSGEFSLLAAEHGLDVVGMDRDLARLERAQDNAAARGLSVTFVQHDALALAALPAALLPRRPPGGRFGTVVDSLHLHALETRSRALYLAGLPAVLEPKGRFVLLSYADDQPDVPHGMSRGAITDAFAGWEVEALDVVRVDTLVHAEGARGWCAVLVAPSWHVVSGSVATVSGERYLRQLADHVGAVSHRPGSDAHQEATRSRHALAATRSGRTATVTSTRGTCTLTATGEGLELEVAASSADALVALRTLLTHRLETIGRRDGLVVRWL